MYFLTLVRVVYVTCSVHRTNTFILVYIHWLLCFWVKCICIHTAHNKEGGNHLDQESNRQKTMEDIDGGLHPAVDEQSLVKRRKVKHIQLLCHSVFIAVRISCTL